ncbi:MAG: hypothetical protein L0219_11465 [Phycisphaerales bacterium]|nr:hypothetical protein [Phycisphaerales bacterium]
MNFLHWLIGGCTVRSSVLSLYKRGLARAERHDEQGAMEAYTAAIDLPDAPDDVKAMALYNRALLFAAAGKTAKAIGDLNAVLAVSAPLRDVKTAARRRLARMQRQHDAIAAVRLSARQTT